MTTATDDRPAARSTNRGRLRGGVGAVFAALVVAVVVGYFAWWSKPTAFGTWGSEISAPQTVADMHPLFFGVTDGYGHSEELSIHGATPVVVTNTADAKLTLVLCRPIDGPFGATGVSLAKACSRASPVAGSKMRTGDAYHDQIVLRIAPRKAGTILVDGVKIRYSRGGHHLWQTGVEQTGMGMEIVVK